MQNDEYSQRAPRRRAESGDSARDRALHVVLASLEGRRFGHELLAELQAERPLPEADAAFAAELVLGLARHRLTAEHLAAHYYRGRWAGLPAPIRALIALGVYQLGWLERVPAYAAVDEAVRRARRFGRIATVVNAVLNKVAQARGDVLDEPPEPDPRRWLSLGPGRGRLFRDPVFPDPRRRPLEHLVAVTSHPPYLVERWHRRFKPTRCRQICDAGQRRPPLTLRPNMRRITPDALLARLAAAGRTARRIEGTDAIVIDDPLRAADLPEFVAGLCQPQDATAQAVLRLAPPNPGEFVFDLCAGAGTKSTQAAELMDDRGVVLATDVDSSRLARVGENARRLGLSCIQTAEAGALDAPLAALGRPPDVILLDAPCSNTGVLARRPEARYRASRQALGSLVRLQRSLLARAAALAGATSRLLYSTCSIEEEENEAAVRAFLEADAGWRVEEQTFTLPDADRDGGFAAVLRRA